MILVLWQSDAGAAMQLLNLFGVAGFLVGPLVVQPFLNVVPDSIDAAESNISTTVQANVGESATVFGGPTSTEISVDGAEDLTRSSDVVYAFVIVAACSVFVGVLMFISFFVEASRSCCRKSKSSTVTLTNHGKAGPSKDDEWDASDGTGVSSGAYP